MFCLSKVILAIAFVAIVNAGYIGGGLEEYGGGEIASYGGGEIASYGGGEIASYGGGEISGYGGEHEEHYEHPKYQFQYSVHDPHTGDEKQQYEERDGDKVQGTYTLKEADGTTRVVNYKADKHTGFNAVVSKIGEPHYHH